MSCKSASVSHSIGPFSWFNVGAEIKVLVLRGHCPVAKGHCPVAKGHCPVAKGRVYIE